MQLEEAVRANAPIVPDVREIDLSDLFDEPAGSSVWKFQELTVAEAANVGKTQKMIKFQQPNYPEDICLDIAFMAVSYVAPEGQKQPTHILFSNLGDRMGWVKFASLRTRFAELFPEVFDLKKAGTEKK